MRVSAGHVLYVYETAPVMAVRGIVEVARVEVLPVRPLWRAVRDKVAITKFEFERYFDGCEEGTSIFLGFYREFQDPIDLATLRRYSPRFQPPQSWASLESLPVKIRETLTHAVS